MPAQEQSADQFRAKLYEGLTGGRMMPPADLTPQERKYLANDLAQAALEWFYESAHRLPFNDYDRMDLARALVTVLDRKGSL